MNFILRLINEIVYKSILYTFSRIKEYSYDDSMDIYLHEDPNTFLFKFSSIGDNEKDPCGYVYINMELFQDSL